MLVVLDAIKENLERNLYMQELYFKRKFPL